MFSVRQLALSLGQHLRAATAGSSALAPTTAALAVAPLRCSITGFDQIMLTRGYAKKAKNTNIGGRSKKKRRGIEANFKRLAEQELKTAEKKEPTIFTPEKLNTSLMRTLELEEIAQRTNDIPTFFAGSTLRVTHRDNLTSEHPRKSVGICIARRNKGLGSNFLLRNVIEGVGFTQQFDLYSPLIEKIEVIELSRRRRAKLYYLKDKALKQSTFKYDMQSVPHTTKKVPIKRPK